MSLGKSPESRTSEGQSLQNGVDGQKRILVVDDDPQVRKIMGIFLGAYEYEVVLGKGLKEGRQLLNQSYKLQRPFDLLMFDGYLISREPKEMTLENLDGAKLARQAMAQAFALQRKNPDPNRLLPVVVSLSGSEHVTTEQGKSYLKESGFVMALQKPFDLDDIDLLATNLNLMRRANINDSLPSDVIKLFSTWPRKWVVLAKDEPQKVA